MLQEISAMSHKGLMTMRSVEFTGPMAVGKTILIRSLTSSYDNAEMVLEDAARVNALFLEVWNTKESVFNINLKQLLLLADLIRKYDAAPKNSILFYSILFYSILFLDRGVQDYLYFGNRA